MDDKTLLVCIEDKYVTEEVAATVKKYSGGRRLVFSTDRDVIEAELDRIDVVLGDLPRDLLVRMPVLQWFQQFGTGVEWMQKNPGTAEASFVLTNCSDNHSMVVADQMFALILAMSRDIPRFVRAQDQRKWDSPNSLGDSRFIELRGKTMLLVGLGSIGRELAKRGAIFGMRITGVRRYANKAVDGVDEIYSIDHLNTAASQADIVAVCLPNTSDTKKLFDSSFFAAMKSSAFFFNIGRGTTVDELALEDALRSNSIAGAGLDVFNTEPLPQDSTLWSAPNLLITPHMGGFYDRVIETWTQIALDNLQRYDEGKSLRNLVDKSSGY